MAARGTQTQELDDGERGLSGVTVSIVERDNGRASLVFDDVGRAGDVPPFHWRTEWFFTRIEFDASDLSNVQLDEKDYGAIGHAIVARLAARAKRGTR